MIHCGLIPEKRGWEGGRGREGWRKQGGGGREGEEGREGTLTYRFMWRA